jgi:methionine transaminase
MMIHTKLPGLGDSIFSTMSALAKQHNAINLSQGFPDFNCSAHLVQLASDYIGKGFNQYPPMPGTIELRERVASIILERYKVNFDPAEEITITAGATQAIYTAIASFIRAGDEVLVLEPAYDCYVPAIEVHGGVPVFSQLNENDFSINWEDVRSKITPKTRAIILNSPHNPSGSVITANDLRQLEKTVEGKNILVISDEVYEHMVFDGQEHESICKSAALREQSIIVSSFGKTIHTTGWKIGYVAAAATIMKEFRKLHQFLVFVVNHPLQLAIADFLSDTNNYRGLANFYQQKRDLFLELTSGSKFQPLPCSGTYFQLMTYENISDESAADFAIRLTKEHKLATVPLSAFYNGRSERKILRFCFAKKEETLRSAAKIMCGL